MLRKAEETDDAFEARVKQEAFLAKPGRRTYQIQLYAQPHQRTVLGIPGAGVDAVAKELAQFEAGTR